jgi:hypothetical protein
MTVALVPRLLCCDPDDLDVSIFLAGVKVVEFLLGAIPPGLLCTLLGLHLSSTYRFVTDH